MNDKKFVIDSFSFFFFYKYIDQSICKPMMKPIFVYLVVMRLNDAKTAVIFLDVKRRVQLDFINYPSVKTILDRANV